MGIINKINKSRLKKESEKVTAQGKKSLYDALYNDKSTELNENELEEVTGGTFARISELEAKIMEIENKLKNAKNEYEIKKLLDDKENMKAELRLLGGEQQENDEDELSR